MERFGYVFCRVTKTTFADKHLRTDREWIINSVKVLSAGSLSPQPRSSHVRKCRIRKCRFSVVSANVSPLFRYFL
ncbi:unnamed protein product [Meloidogyne enterolobii]|uniref:Uncharacterized protein n=1 Tax=Meloidogyne enterolobii TaxID=390850 RepID=A0ACB0ZNN9_MELEN